jgi:hypothetical protein
MRISKSEIFLSNFRQMKSGQSVNNMKEISFNIIIPSNLDSQNIIKKEVKG